MLENKTTLLCLRTQDWRTVMSESEKVSDLLTNILKNDTTELNDFIYAGANFACEELRSSRRPQTEIQNGWELRLESQIKRLWQQARILKRNIKKYSDEIEKTQELELKNAWGFQPKNNGKIRKTKRCQDKINNIGKTGHSKTMKKILPTIRGRMVKAISTTRCESGWKVFEYNMGTERTKSQNG